MNHIDTERYEEDYMCSTATMTYKRSSRAEIVKVIRVEISADRWYKKDTT